MSNSGYCRLCLNTDLWDSPLPIFSNSLIPSKLVQLFGVEVKQNDKLPQVICHLCLAKVSFIDEFHKVVIKSTDLLKIFGSELDRTEHVTSGERKDSNIILDKTVPFQTPKAKVVPHQVAEVQPAFIVTNELQNPKCNNSGKSSKLQIKKRKKLSALKTRASSVHNYKCSRCKFHTTSAAKYKEHVENQSSCSICSMCFCSDKGRRIHMAHAHMKDKKDIKKDNGLGSNFCLKDDASDKNSTCDSTVEKNFEGKSGDEREKKDGNKLEDLTDSSYLDYWCKKCDHVFLNTNDLNKHLEEIHSIFPENLPMKNQTSQVRKKGRKHSAGDSDNETEFKRKKNLFSPSAEINCWKCKQVFKCKQELFVHQCLSNNKDYKSTTPHISTSVNENEEENNDSIVKPNGNKERDDENETIENRRQKSKKGSQQISDGEGNSDNSEHNDKDLESHRDSDSDVEFIDTLQNEDSSFNYNSVLPKIEDEESNNEDKKSNDIKSNSSLIKKCNECNENFQSLKALVLHKRVHKTVLSNYYKFSLHD